MLVVRWLFRVLLSRLVRGLLSALSGVVNVGFGLLLMPIVRRLCFECVHCALSGVVDAGCTVLNVVAGSDLGRSFLLPACARHSIILQGPLQSKQGVYPSLSLN